MDRHLFIISFDALGAKDLEDIESLPNFKKIKEQGAHVKKVRSVYPSLTYPAHTSIITGHYPLAHGIVNNTKIQPDKASPDWYWYKDAIKVPTLYELAKAKGYKTASFLWPVAAHSGIDYNIAEIFPNRFWLNQVMVSLWGSSPLFLLNMNKKYGHLRNGIEQPQLDDFITASVIDTIQTKKPGLLMAHFVDMDSMRHRYGVTSDEAKSALQRHDKRLGEIIEATKEAGIFEKSVFAVLGDHYQIDVDTILRLNILFAEYNWLSAGNDNKIETWQVYAKSCDGSAYIYIKNPELESQVFEVLQSLPGIEKVYNSTEIIRLGADAEATFMVEGIPGCYFMDNIDGPLVEEVTPEKIGQPDYYNAVHGYHPQKKDYETTLLLSGPGIKRGKEVEQASLIDEAPTFARILGFKMPKVEGQVITDIFEGE
ncbi:MULTISPECIES: ectonucleotide pyrophosphatase/phosphodiesterase [Listeria]|uniref:alkaline phosphatase family protein n=1 Tax=Listeria TaxID=1637 RepID=UPI000B587756|nr:MULTISPECIES: ectonucleotide pyrophosphatase/phosphodiesterase [Listeria]